MYITNRQRLVAVRFLLLLVLADPLIAQTAGERAVYIPYDDAQQILKTLDSILPPELKGKTPEAQAAIWPGWVARRDAEIRGRLLQGDEDSLVNFLLFGTSYTRQPRITLKQLAEVGQIEKTSAAGPTAEQSQLTEILQQRADDVIRGIAAPGDNERLLFARRLLEGQKGYHPETAAGRTKIKEHLLASLVRMLNEQAGYAKILEGARLSGSATEEFVERSRLFRERGLSSDTSLRPNFAIEEALKAAQARRLLATGGVRRVAIIGPGLDFTDKQEGYDFYPQQTIQPFAVIDTLLRLGLARPDSLTVSTFDLSPRVNDHLERARQRARNGQSYVVQLPRDPQEGWKPDFIRYWERFGDRIGSPVPPMAVPAGLSGLKTRAVRIRPPVVARITPRDLNVVLQRLPLPPAERFDLIIGTNIFVYYDVFEQSLAQTNVERMLRPGGLLLSNNALVEFPFIGMQSAGYLTVVYSDRPNDGDHIVWYRRTPN